MSEDALQKQIVNYCRTVLPRSAKVLHIPNGGHRNKVTAARLKALGVMAGAPDLMIVTQGHILFAEIKTETGRVSPAQRAWADDVRALGFYVAIWRTPDCPRNTFKALGIKTKEQI